MLPPARVRPQGGGVANIDDEALFAAIIYVLVGGCAWRALPPCFGASKSTDMVQGKASCSGWRTETLPRL